MHVSLSYFDGCPNWQVAYERLAEALSASGHDDTVIQLVPVTSEHQAIALEFAGSPTIRIDGVDPFADEAPQFTLACRLYATPEGVDGSPSRDQLLAAIRESR